MRVHVCVYQPRNTRLIFAEFKRFKIRVFLLLNQLPCQD